jgi:sugar lactone lactonase YvrE
MKKVLFVASLFISALCSQSQTLTAVESVEYDPIIGRFLVTNGNNIVEVDGDGESVANMGGDSEADYGMEFMNGVVFAISGSHVKGFNHSDGTQVMDLTVSGAQFLNGMASDGDHRLWVTDFSAKEIHEIDLTDLSAPVLTTVVSNTVSTPNGIVYDEINNRLVFVNWGSNAAIKSVDLNDNYTVATIVTTNLSNCDGIDNDENNNFYVSSWTPTRITRFNYTFATSEIITAPGIGAPADICYAKEIDTLAIPNSSLQTVTYVGFGSANVDEADNASFMTCYPNPVDESSVISFELAQSGQTTLQILDVNGRLVAELINENLSAGKHRVLLVGVKLSAGSYICRLQSASINEAFNLIKQ